MSNLIFVTYHGFILQAIQSKTPDEGVIVNNDHWEYQNQRYKIGSDVRVPKGGYYSGPMMVIDPDNEQHKAILESYTKELEAGMLSDH